MDEIERRVALKAWQAVRLVLLFVVIGPPIGLIVFALTTISAPNVTPREYGLLLALSYMGGAIPAFLTGALYALMPYELRNILIAAMLGAIISVMLYGIFCLLMAGVGGLGDTLRGLAQFSGAGAAAGFVCSALEHVLSLKLTRETTLTPT